MATHQIAEGLQHKCQPSSMKRAYDSYFDLYSRGPYGQFLREHHLVGSMPARLLHVVQPAGDFPDPPIGEFLLYVALKGASELKFDWGCGRWCSIWHVGDVSIAPPNVGTDIHISQAHAFLGLALPKDLVVRTLREEAHNTTIADFGALHTATFRDDALVRQCKALWH